MLFMTSRTRYPGSAFWASFAVLSALGLDSCSTPSRDEGPPRPPPEWPSSDPTLRGRVPAPETDETTQAPIVTQDPTAERIVDFDGVRVAYWDEGEGESTLLFVPGWVCDHCFFDEQRATLPAQHRCLFVDLPGHGLSDKPRREYDMDFLARALLAVMDDAEVEKAVVIGHSNGAALGLHLARQHPERCSGLVSIDGTLRPRYEDERVRAAVTASFRGPDYPRVVRDMFESMFPDDLSRDRRDRLLAAVARTPAHVAISTMDQVNDPANWPDAPTPIAAPLLVLNAQGPFWTAEDEQHARAISTDTTYRVLPGVGHLLMLESPADFHLHLSEWLTRSK